MKIVLTKEEFTKLHDYIEYKVTNEDPCYKCTENGQCCGCGDKTTYEEGIRKIGLPNDILENPTLKAYIHKRIAYHEAMDMVQSWSDSAKIYFADAQKYRDMFKVEGQIKEETSKERDYYIYDQKVTKEEYEKAKEEHINASKYDNFESMGG